MNHPVRLTNLIVIFSVVAFLFDHENFNCSSGALFVYKTRALNKSSTTFPKVSMRACRLLWIGLFVIVLCKFITHLLRLTNIRGLFDFESVMTDNHP